MINNTDNPDLPCELLDIPGARNVRDIGGYIGSGGNPVRKRRFIRAGGMHSLTDDGINAVRALGVDCIVDLRSNFEAKAKPDTLMCDGQVVYVHIPMLDYIQSSMNAADAVFPTSLAEMYIGLLENDKAGFLRLMKVFADPVYSTVLFHCTAGKDRTGLSTMLLLGLAGVSRADIIGDYSLTERLFPPRQIHPDLPRYLFEAPPEMMEAALDHLDSNYGGILAYLSDIGVDEISKAALLKKLF